MRDNENLQSSPLSLTLLSQLENYEAHDERENTSLARLIMLLTNVKNDNVFDQVKSNEHITGSAFVISSSGLLLHFHKKIPRWLQPGGHLEVGESPLHAAQRETFEETGIHAEFSPEIFHVDVHDTPNGHIHYDIRYLARSQTTALRPPMGESQKVAWFKPAALPSLPDIAIFGAIAKLMESQLFE